MVTPNLLAVPQGDVALLGSEVAQKLLASNIYARLAYSAVDGTPRVQPIWFYWNGHEVVMGTALHAAKVVSLRKHPAVAITIDTQDPPQPPSVLLLRGQVAITVRDDVFDEWVAAARKYLGEEGAAQWQAHYQGLDSRWARIALRPSWVGLLDFQERIPGALAGVGGKSEAANAG
jgi:hypothetical protein